MTGILILQLISQAFGTWPMWGGDLSHRSVQLVKGAITIPVIKWRAMANEQVECQFSAIADCDGYGGVEVLIGSDDNKLYCLSGYTGFQKWAFTTSGDVESSPAVADCDGDGAMEVVVGSRDYKVYCLRGSDGTLKWSFTAGFYVKSSPAIADCDGDGAVEVVIGSDDSKLYCLRGSDGTPKWVFSAGSYITSSPAVADCDGDGNLDVVVASWDSRVYCVRGTDGALKWTFATGNYIRSSPAIADCDGDGAVEVVIGSDDSKLYCLRGSDGTPKWVRTFPSRIHLPGALVDVDGDGKLETLVSQISYSGSPTDTLYALNAEDGSVCWKIGLPYDVHSPFAGDIDGDMCVEIITGTYHTDAQGYRIFAIDDPENTSGCGLLNIGEAGASDGLEFKAIGGKEIYLFLPKETRVSVSLYDASGKLIQRFYDGILAQGAHTFVLNPENKGVYLAILRWKEGVKTAKIVR